MAVEGAGSRLEMHLFGDPATEISQTVWTSPCAGDILAPGSTRRLREAVGAMVFAAACDTEVQVHVLDTDTREGERAPDLRFTVEERAYDWPVLQPPPLTWDATGFWYVQPLPTAGVGAAAVGAGPWHLFHVTVPLRGVA